MVLSYSKIVEIAQGIIENGKIPIENLVMVYTLPEKQHFKLNEDLFYRTTKEEKFEPSDVIEIEVCGVQFRIDIEKNVE
jgi:hypothetical protein